MALLSALKELLWWLLAVFGVALLWRELGERRRERIALALAPLGKWGVDTFKAMGKKAGGTIREKLVERAGDVAVAGLIAAGGVAGLGVGATALVAIAEPELFLELTRGPTAREVVDRALPEITVDELEGVARAAGGSVIVVGGADTPAEFSTAVDPGSPDAPTLAVAVLPGDTAAWASTSAFSGDPGDSHSYSIFQWDTVTGDFDTSPIAVDTISAPQVRDTVGFPTGVFGSGGVYKVRALHAGSAGGESSFSVVDTFTARAQIFEMDLSEGAYPLAGFDAIRDTITNVYDLSQRLGVGPNGENAYVFDIGGESTSSPPRQPDIGWYVELDTLNDPIGYGQTVYVRTYFRWMANTVCLGWNFGTAEDDAEAKFHMIADTSPGGDLTGRTMIRLRCEAAADSTTFGVARANSDQRCNGDGTFGFPNAFDVPNDTSWVAIQYRLTWSSAVNVTDGSYALWINNTDPENPNCEADHTALAAAYPGVDPDDLAIINATGSWYRFELGFFWNSIPDLSRGGDFGFEIAGYEIGTSFDPSWGN